MTLLLIALLSALVALGAPIFAAMLGFALLGASHTARDGGSTMTEFAGQLIDVLRLGTGEPAAILATIPLFILAGYLMAEARAADRLVRFAQALVGWLPGGLAVVTIVACAVFTTFTGASGVTIVALGGLVMPSLIKEQYPERFALGLVAGTGSVGLLFPPALPLFVYGTVYGLAAQTMTESKGQELELISFSTDRFLFAGIVPGLVLLGMLGIYAVIVAVVRKVPRYPFRPAALVRATLVALPELIIPALIIAGLLGGMTVPEVAALTALYVLLIEMALYRDIRPRDLWRISQSAMALVGAIFIIIFAATALTNYFVTAKVPDALVAWITAHIESKWAFLLALNLILLIVGMLMDIFSAIVVVVPLITPAAMRFGIDPYHLGVIFLLNLEIGYLTPPVGLNLFITSFQFKKPILEVVHASLPFLAAMIAALAVITYVPALTVVPEPPRKGRLTDLVQMVRKAQEALSSVTQVALPGGGSLALADCERKPDDLGKIACRNLFKDVTRCRKEAGGKSGSPCETGALDSYAASEKSDTGEDDWFEEEEGKPAAGENAPPAP